MDPILPSDDEEAFLKQFRPLGFRLAEEAGYAVERPPGAQLPVRSRVATVENRTLRGLVALGELQRWLRDYNPNVRAAARDGIHECLYAAYTGDHPDRGSFEASLGIIDRWVRRILAGNRGPDVAESHWLAPVLQRRLRLGGILGVVLAGAATALLFALGRPALALGLVALVAVVDILEGSASRATEGGGAYVGWFSCLASHFADLLILTGIALDQYRHADAALGLLVVAAMAMSLFGSFVRVSALQAGFRFWRSRLERVVRFSSFIAYAICDLAGVRITGVVVVVALVALFGIGEGVRVIREARLCHLKAGMFVFVGDENKVEAWDIDQSASPRLAHRASLDETPRPIRA